MTTAPKISIIWISSGILISTTTSYKS